ncbi:MAG: hypothetical protein NXY57DRAFT_958402 [Lentinula lateritia]|nr:MAG: hypothetical protein NXY57DRAFT_958402 [Lentinula lateritia]
MVTITLDSLTTNEVTVNVDIFNPTDAELQVLAIQSTGSIDGTVYAQFSTTFDSYLIPAGQTVNSGEIDHVLLTQGAIASLGIIGENLDVAAANTIQVGVGGYTLPWLKINQLDVPTTYTLDIAGLTLGQLKSQAEQNASSISSSAVGSIPTSASTSQNGSTSVSATVSLSSLASSTITSSTTGDGTTAEATLSATSSAGKEDSSTATSATANTPLMPASSASDAAPTSATLVATLLV